MKLRTITTDELKALLADIITGRQIIAPVEEDGRYFFRPVDSVDAIVFEPVRTVNNIKDFFFPPRQVLYEFKREGIRSVPQEDEERLILFPRPCDVRAMEILDRLFIGDYKDESYARLRKNTVIAGMGCTDPAAECFCLSVGGEPFGTEGMDVSIVPAGSGEFYLRVLTESGKKVFRETGALSGGDENTFNTLKKRAEASIKKHLDIPADLPDTFDSEYWKGASLPCIMCGICTYLCPTCHCFDIVDEGFLKIRCWDTCHADTFTRMAAGETPRDAKWERYRQRVFHKFSYYRENFDVIACVGCGRCSRHCPVSMDIVTVVNEVT